MMYTKKTIEHFTNPRNVGVIENANGIGTIGDPDCGDFVRLYVFIQMNRLKDMSFEICGCPASIATVSMLTDMVLGKTLHEAISITETDVDKQLGGLPEEKKHCSNLGVAALRQAIVHYLQNNRQKKSV